MKGVMMMLAIGAIAVFAFSFVPIAKESGAFQQARLPDSVAQEAGRQLDTFYQWTTAISPMDEEDLPDQPD